MTLVSKNVWKIVAFLLVLSLISFALISGTFARYTSTFAGEDTALVAKWSFTGSGSDFVINNDGTDTLTLDLFSHTFTDYITETAADGKYIIAPGVSGDFQIQVTNNSDVAATMSFELSLADGSADVPIEYSLGDDEFTSPLDEDGLDLALDDAFSTLDAGASTVLQTVYWRWKIDGDDGQDTDLGRASAEEDDRTFYGLSITLTAEQIAPE